MDRDKTKNMISSEDMVIVLQHAKVIYWEYDMLASVAYCSKMMQEKYDMPQVIENYPEDYLRAGYVAEENIHEYREACRKIREGVEYVEFDARIRTQKQNFEWIRIKMTGIKNADRQPIRAICTAERIEEYKELERKFTTTLRQNKIASWKYDLKNHKTILDKDNHYRFTKNENEEIENVPESQIQEGLCHPDDIETFRQMYRRLYAGAQQVESIIRFKDSRSKTFRWKKCVYTLMADDSGEPTYAIGSAVDVSDKMEAEQLYNAAMEYRKRTQVENLLFSGHCSVTKDSVIEMNDLTGGKILDKQYQSRREFYSKLKEYILDPEKKKEVDRFFSNESIARNYEKGIHEAALTCEISLEEQKRTWVVLHVSVIRTPDIGDLEGFLTVVDVTEAHIQELLLNKVVESDYDYIMLVDIAVDRYKLYAASDEHSMSDVAPSGIYSEELKRYADKHIVPEDYKLAVDEMSVDFLQKVLRNQSIYKAQIRLMEEDGGISYKQMKFFYLDERHTQLVITRVDITSLILEQEKKRTELSRALQLAEQATKSKTDFFARMSHDMRTPLNGILGCVNLAIEAEKHTPQMAEYLHDIQFSGDFLLNLINDVLDISKMESGAMELFPEEYTYSEFISNMIKMIEPLCRKKNITLNMNPLEGDIAIRVDILRFQQIFFNIFSNAVKYTPEGGTIDHYTEVQPLDANHIDCRCHIIDNGIGMSQEFLKHLFEPYSQEHQKFTTVQGTGLGLSIASNLVHLMGGDLTVNSELGKGTEVIIHTILEIIEPSGKNRAEKKTEKVKESEILKGCHILLCEDHPLNAKIAIRLLEQREGIVEHAENGELGVKLFEDSPVGYYDLILMDIRMPVMDGLQATINIRNMERIDAKTVPIIAMTANAYEADIKESLNAGMNAHLAKPISSQKFYETLVEHIKKS